MRLADPSAATLAELETAGVDVERLRDVIRVAIDEDLEGAEDVTTVATVPAGQRSEGLLVARGSGVVAGLPAAIAVFETVCGPDGCEVERLATDGTRVTPGTQLARITGRTRELLVAERTALNLLCHLSGVASLTRRWADALEGTSARVRDTRKTTPGLRSLEKYAVRCGGGVNHRMSLVDAALVKDNHVLAAGGVAEAFAAVRALAATIPVEIEVDSLEGLAEAISAGADVVLLDNFEPEGMAEAVELRNEMDSRVILEASGGLTLESARRVGETGVDFIAVGELTHSAKVLDIGFDLRAVV